jgi:hypothetical protein
MVGIGSLILLTTLVTTGAVEEGSARLLIPATGTAADPDPAALCEVRRATTIRNPSGPKAPTSCHGATGGLIRDTEERFGVSRIEIWTAEVPQGFDR